MIDRERERKRLCDVLSFIFHSLIVLLSVGYSGGGQKYSGSLYTDESSRRSSGQSNNNNNFILPTYSSGSGGDLGQIFTDVRIEGEKKNLLTLPTDPNKMYIKQVDTTNKRKNHLVFAHTRSENRHNINKHAKFLEYTDNKRVQTDKKTYKQQSYISYGIFS